MREQALDTLAKLEPATLAQYSDAVVARLDDSTCPCIAAVKALGKLEPTTLAQLTSAVLEMVDVLEDDDGSLNVRTAVVATLRALPRCVIHDLDLESNDLDYLHGRLLGRLAWYRCRLRWRVQRFALYWYSLPYRPSGPGHARDVEAWDRMVGSRDERQTTSTSSAKKRQIEITDWLLGSAASRTSTNLAKRDRRHQAQK